MTLKTRVARLKADMGTAISAAVLVISRPGPRGEPLVIGGTKHEYMQALRRLRGEEEPPICRGITT
jgi:hypothetical protein